MEKQDNSPEEEAIKDNARKFMQGLVGTPEDEDATAGPEGIEIVNAWKNIYNSASSDKDNNEDLMDKFWSSVYDPKHTSIWSISYDETDSTENLQEAIEIVTSFMKQTMPIQKECFGIMHTLETYEIEGVWLFNGPNPEQMYGMNEDSSWFTFKQLGPAPLDSVKKRLSSLMVPSSEQTIGGRGIKNTQVFSHN
jgi:hypothetical protein